MPAFESLPEALAILLRVRGMSQKELARRTGLTPSQLSHYLDGDVAPSLRNLSRLLDGLGATLFDFALAEATAAEQAGRFAHPRQAADLLAESDDTVLLTRGGGLLVPASIRDRTAAMIAQVFDLLQAVRDVERRRLDAAWRGLREERGEGDDETG
jgi:transcriptional regulator with XRE-family HTH domain